MSEHTRAVFRAALVASTPTLFVETIGQMYDLRGMPDLWTTIDFPLVQSARMSLGYPACYREQGSVFVHVMARSGTGDAVAIHEAELIRSYFDAHAYVNDARVLVTHPPMLISPTDSGDWLDVVVSIDYEWDYVVAAPLPLVI